MQLPLPENEVGRLENLRSYAILDTPPEQAFDDLTRLAAYICGTPIALIGFIDLDRQWFKSHFGWDVKEVPRDMTFCSHTILEPDLLVVSDTLEDSQRLGACPLATLGGIRFYAGAPLISGEGFALGTLCVMDSVPRGLTEGQTDALRKLARQVMTQLESHRRSASPPFSPATAKLPERGDADRTLPEPEALFRSVTEAASDAIMVIDETSNILFVNRATESIFGYRKEELLGQQLALLVPDYPPDMDRQVVAQPVDAENRSLSWRGAERVGLHKSGREICLQISFGEFVRDGKRVFAGTCRDITEHKRVEKERFQLAAIVESAEDAVIGKNLKGIITSWNKGAERIYGYGVEEVLGKSVSILVPRSHVDETAVITERLERGKHVQPSETVRITKTGGRIHVSLTASPIRDEAGNIVGSSTIERDISLHKQAEETVIASEKHYRSVFENMVCGICRMSVDGQFLEVNPALAAMLGYDSPDEIVKLSKANVYADQEELSRLTHKWLEKERIEDEVNWNRRNGEIIRVRLSGRTMTDTQDIVQGFEFIAEEVTERRVLEAQLRHALKIEAVGQLAGGIAHEFNNFLGVILGYSELMLEDAGDNESLRLKIAEIRSASQRAASMTRQLLAFSRKQLLEPRVLDLNQVIWETSNLLRRLVPTNISVVPVLAPTIGHVKVDPGQIQQILINLVVNARDAMPEGGKVVIETANADLDEESARHRRGLQPGHYVTLIVSDTGCGMDAGTLSRVFEPFFTTKPVGKGTGLGLSTIFGIVKQSGGDVTLESDVGRGTTFRIYLPRVEVSVESANSETPALVEPNRAETILLVEDEIALRRLICLCIEKCGYKVLAAKDGAEAIEVFCQHQDHIALVVSDIMMPHVDGFELKQRVATLRPAVKFLFMSGHSEQTIEQRQTLAQGCAFLEKPFLPDELTNKIRELLRVEVAA